MKLIQYIDEYLLQVNKSKEEKFLVEKSNEFHSKIFSLLENNHADNSINSFDDDFKTFNYEYEQYLPSIAFNLQTNAS